MFRWVGGSACRVLLWPFWSRATLRVTLKSCDHRVNACGVAVVRDCAVCVLVGIAQRRPVTGVHIRRTLVFTASRSRRRGRPLSGTFCGAATSRSRRRGRPLSGTFFGAATSRSRRRGRPLSGTFCGAATSRSRQRGRPLTGTVLWCRDKPFPAKGAAAVGHQGLGARSFRCHGGAS